MTKFLNAVYAWYQGEPLIAHNVAAFALTVLAHYGVHLDANTTALIGTVLAGLATGLTHRKVAPVPAPTSNESGAVDKVFLILAFIAVCIGLITWRYLHLHTGA